MTGGDCYPLYMEISPVGNCNHRCIFCAYDFIGYPNRKLETARTVEILNELGDLGLKSILFAGEGEPLLHPDIAALIDAATKSGIDAGLFTNGQLLIEELAREVLPRLTFVRFSFNAGSAENYAQIHSVPPEAFEKAVANIGTAARIKREEGLRVTLGAQFVLIPENIDTVCQAALTLREAGIDYLAIKPFVHQSELQGYRNDATFPGELLEATFERLESLSTDRFQVLARRESFAGYGKRQYRQCFGTSFITVLNSAGVVSSCLPYWECASHAYGSIYEASFRDIWLGERRMEVKRRLEQELDARLCPPNCRPHAVNQFISEILQPSVEHVNFI